MSLGVPSRVLVVQHARAEPPGLVARALETKGIVLTTVRTFDGDSVPREIGDAAGLLFHMEVTDEIVASMADDFAAELETAGVAKTAILAGAKEHLASLSERGSRVFAGWADQVAAYGDLRP